MRVRNVIYIFNIQHKKLRVNNSNINDMWSFAQKQKSTKRETVYKWNGNRDFGLSLENRTPHGQNIIK